MAIYDVTGPDGKQYEVEGPPGASQAEVLARVQAFKMAKPKARNTGTGMGAVDSLLSTANEFIQGVPEGLYNMGAAVTDPLLRPFVGDEAVNRARQQRAKVSDAVSRTFTSRPNPAARTAGQIASTIPLAGLKVGGAAAQYAPRLATIGTRGLQGAIGGAGVRDVGGDDAGTNAMIGAGMNVALPPVLGAIVSKIGTSRPVQALADAVSPYARRALGAVDDVAEGIYSRVAPSLGARPLPKVPPRLPVAQTAQAAEAPVRETLGRQAQARLDTFRSLGIKNPTTAMVTRDPAAWTYERNTSKLAGIGDDLVSSFQEVNKGLDDEAARLVRARGGARDPEKVGEVVQDVLDTKQKEMQTAVSQLYKAVRENKGEKAAGSLNTFIDLLDDPDLADNSAFDSIRGDVMKRLGRFGMTGTSGLPRKGAVITVKQAEELRQFIGKLGNSTDPNIRRIRATLIDTLDDDIVEAVGDDAFKGARAAARARFEEFGKTFAGKLADGKVTSEKTVQRILSGSNKDLRALRESLSTGTPEQIERGKQAWNDIGAQAVDDFFSKARGTDAEGTLSAAKLKNAFKRDGAKLKEILTPEEFTKVSSIVRATQYANTAVPFSAVNNSNSASALANMFADAPKGKPGVGRKVMSNIAQHALAFGVGGAPANLALAGTKYAAGEIAAQRAAKAALAKVEMAKSPEAAAAALKAVQAKASRDAAFRAAVKRWQDGGFYSSFGKFGPGAGR